jgi:outer membrane PBP1 activator LpoA protein
MLSVLGRKIVAGVTVALLYGATEAIATDHAPRAAIPVALLLPLQSPAFAKLADSVRQGVLAAAKSDPNAHLAITLYSTTDEPNSTFTAYEQALAHGNRLIIGPLTRNGVSRIAQRIQPGVPVLALNSPEDNAPLAESLYAFSLQVETEARQIARIVFVDGRRNVLTVTDSSLLARRIHAAFADEFVRQGGALSAQFAYSTATADLLALRESANSAHTDAVFLALDAVRARLVRPYVDGPAQVYATSQVFDGPTERLRDAELNGVRFVDMPWLLQPDHPAVMIYTRPETPAPIAGDSERLYALGIDAYRIAADMLSGSRIAREPLDGVTGRISLTPERYFVRELTPAQFADGRPIPLSARP